MHGMIKPPRMVAVSARPRIGKLEMIRREFSEGHSLADMARAIGPDMPPEFFAIGIAIIDDGLPIEPQHWHLVRPKAGHCVAFHPMPGKEGGLFQTFAQISIIAAQAFAYTIPGVGPIVAAGIGLGGAALLGSMAKKPKSPKPPKQLGQAGFSDNVLAPYDQLGRVLGIRRVPASYLVPPYIDLDVDNAYGVAVIGLAGRYDFSGLEIAGTPADLFDSSIREGDASDLDLSLYTKVRWQEPGGDVSRHNTRIDPNGDTRTTMVNSPVEAEVERLDWPKPQFFRLGKRRFPNRVILDYLFDQGCYWIAGGKAGVPFQLSFVKEGETTVFLPEMHVAINYKTPTRVKLVIEFAADPGGITAPNSGHIWAHAFASYFEMTAGADAHVYYGSPADTASHVGVSGDNIATIYCDPASIPLDGTWRLSVKVGFGYRSANISYSNGSYSSSIITGVGSYGENQWFGNGGLSGPIYLIGEDQAALQTHLVLSQFTREYDTDVLAADGIGTYEIQTLNQSVEQVTFIAGSYVDKRWDSVTATWVAEPHVSNNPAELAYDIMTNASRALNARPLDASIVDAAGLGEWAEYCTEQGLTCNAFIDGGSMEDALQICFEAGHAYLKRSQKWGVYIERDRTGETPVMVFSPRNSRGFRAERSYDHRPHALRVTFDDEDDDYQTHPDLVVYAPGYDETTATNFLSKHYPGITQEWQAVARARLDLGIIWYRAKTYSLETDARYLVAGRGDFVGISHFVLNAAHGFAAIREVIRQEVGGVTKITGFILDTDLDMRPTTTGIAINTYGGTVVSTQSVQEGKTRELILSVPLTDDLEIAAGCTITSGEVGSMRIDCIIDDVLPGAGGTARLVLYDAAPEIFGPVLDDLYASPDLYGETDLYNLD